MLSRRLPRVLASALRSASARTYPSIALKPAFSTQSLSYSSLRSFSVSCTQCSPKKKQIIQEDEEVDEIVVKKPKKATTSTKAKTAKAPAKKATTTKSKAKKAPAVKNKAAPKKAVAKKAAPKKASAAKPKLTSTVKLPKRISSAWMLYYQDRMPDLRASVPAGEKFSVSKSTQQAAEDYKKLSQAEKDELNERLEEVKETYKIQLQEAIDRLTPDQIKLENQRRAAKRKSGSSHKKNLIDPKKPKRPMSAFFIYLDTKRQDADWLELAKSNAVTNSPSKSGRILNAAVVEFSAVAKQAGDEWRAMSEDEKKRYHDQAQEALATYKEAMIEYAGTQSSASTGSSKDVNVAESGISESASALASH